tara:strand:- start:2580 stop:5261 length:2682 start_codon:yes stop_codon:yes gene_type:complete
MKLSIRENLSKFNLINEGWMESLFNKYDEDILYFVGIMLQKAFSDEDISNHPMAEWIAKSTKGFLRGGSMPMKEPYKTQIENSFQDILNFIKESENQKEDIKEILSKNPKDALKYVKEKEEARLKSEELSGEEELKKWIDDGILKIIGRGPKGSFWVQPLKPEFFGIAQCGTLKGMSSHNSGEFGIGCQKGSEGGGGAVGFPSSSYAGVTYTLLGKSKDGHYTGIISTGANPQNKTFVYHTLQFGNKTIGSEGWNNFSAKDFMNAFTEFIAKNEYGKKIYKPESYKIYQSYDGDKFPSPFSYLNEKDNEGYLIKLLENNDDFALFYEKPLREILGDRYDSILIGAREMYEKDPEEFMKRLSSYLSSEGEEVKKILGEINLKDFIENYGSEIIEDNLKDILSTMQYKDFKSILQDNINFERFIKNSKLEDLEEIIREFSERENNADKFLEILNELTEEKAIIKKLGGGNESKGIIKLMTLLKRPRLSKHQNYRTEKDGKTIATVKEVKRDEDNNLVDYQGRVIMKTVNGDSIVYDEEGNEITFESAARKIEYINRRKVMKDVEREVLPSLSILQPKQLRKFLKNNEDYIKKVINFNGDKEKSEINFIRLFLKNSNEKDREKGFRKEKDTFISYYDKKSEGLPGILEYSNILYPGDILGAGDGFVDGVKIFKLDKADIKMDESNPYFKTIFNYYLNSALGSKKEKLPKALGAILETAKRSGLHESEIKKYADKFLKNIESYSGIDGLVYFMENYLLEDEIFSKEDAVDYFKNKDIKESDSYKSFIERLELDINLKKNSDETLNKIKNIKNFAIIGLNNLWNRTSADENGKEEFLKIIKKDKYSGTLQLRQNDKVAVYSIKSKNVIRDENIKNNGLNEQKIRKYIQNLLYDNVKKY